MYRCVLGSSSGMEEKPGTEVKASVEWKSVVEGRVQSENEGRNSVEVEGLPSERAIMDGVGGSGIAGGGERGANDERDDVTETTRVDGGLTATTGWSEAKGSDGVYKGDGGPPGARKMEEDSVMLAVRAVWLDESNDQGDMALAGSSGEESHELGESIRGG